MKLIKITIITIIAVFICTLTVACNENNTLNEIKNILQGLNEKNINCSFVAYDQYFYNVESSIDKAYLCGVNMGLTEATTSLDDPDVSYETYMEWFDQIYKMNANTIKIFTIMPPQFYHAFADFNENKEKPLYLIQGIWFNENYMYTYGDVYDGTTISDAFEKACRETVDIIHGNSDYTSYGSISPAVYDKDVSKYLAGYILGLEWDYDFVENTNRHEDRRGYTGEYLYTSDAATAFESFLCKTGDYIIQYQTEEYHFQTPVAFLNWQTTDTMPHDNEPFEEEDRISVNTENIIASSKYGAGLFAAIDVYPYYPEFMNHQPEYTEFKDPDTGKMNPYRAYLRALYKQYTMPVIIAEAGLPTSRGCAHESVMGYDQGGITEQQQGASVSEMIKNIYAEGYAGSMIFSWQDEWFKQTWNTVQYTPEESSARTPNVMSAEQSYGILAMDAGATDICFADGDFSEWNEDKKVADGEGYSLYAKYNEAYLYLYIKPSGNYDFTKDEILIPIQTVGLGSSFTRTYQTEFTHNADFLLVVNGSGNTRLLADGYYDLFRYNYCVLKNIFPDKKMITSRDSGIYNPIEMFISNEMTLPRTGKTAAAKSYEAGLLILGNNNPESTEYNSLADFCGNNSGVEIRIPWYMLNIVNSSLKMAIGDMQTQGEIYFEQIQTIYAGIGLQGNKAIELSDTGYNGIENVSFHTRLKKSYDILQNTIWEIMK